MKLATAGLAATVAAGAALIVGGIALTSAEAQPPAPHVMSGPIPTPGAGNEPLSQPWPYERTIGADHPLKHGSAR